ncbi:MAG: acetylxylan esterase [Mucilaginibacter sp.]|nr:acetylxylan esterase [Mucilaginibacter sp.]
MNVNLRIPYIFSILIIAVFRFSELHAQAPADRNVKIIVSPNHADWTYKTGDEAKFDVTILKSNYPLSNVKIYYEIGLERMLPEKKDSVLLTAGKTVLAGGTLRKPGFLRCIVTAKVDGIIYRGLATCGFEPMAINTYADMPADFLDFWNNNKKELATIPIDAKMTLLPERCTANTNVYQLNLQGFDKNSRLYGILCIPKKEGKYPALLKVPGAGIRPYNGELAMAEKGIITLEIGIHGIPVTLDPQVYINLADGALKNYSNINIDNRDRFYFKRVYMNCLRANDFLTSLPQYDGVNLGVIGGSQGGALSIVTAALDSRVKYLSVMYPALSDLTATLHGRAGGWPHYFENDGLAYNNQPDKLKTIGYYDVVNFARQLKVPGIYSWGFNDESCPPSSTYAAYNQITSPKTLIIVPETGHWGFPEQNEKMSSWLVEQLKKH